VELSGKSSRERYQLGTESDRAQKHRKTCEFALVPPWFEESGVSYVVKQIYIIL